MKRTLLIALALGLGIMPTLVLAGIVTNDKGTSGAPLSVSTVATVLDYHTERWEWCIEPETVAIRCQLSVASAAPTPQASSSVGWFIPAATMACERLGNQANGAIGNPIARVDCASTGGATNVDTWEERGATP